jgi:DNA mismatch endonuclease, patch repair protein
MADRISKNDRSKIMSTIRSENTKIETLVFRELRKRKIYFQKHYSKIDGKPDIALPKKKKAIFIDGDFWHGYGYFGLIRRLPKGYWKEKIRKNVKRDKRVNRLLRKQGWKIIRIWEHDLLNNFDKSIEKIVTFLEK